MAETLARSGKNTLLQMGDGGSPEAFDTILEVRAVNGPNETAELEDVTHMNSPGNYKEFITTLLEGGDCPFECNFVPGDPAQEVLHTAFKAQLKKNMRLVMPAGDKRYEFTSFLTQLGRAFPHNGAMKLTGTFKLTGELDQVANT